MAEVKLDPELKQRLKAAADRNRIDVSLDFANGIADLKRGNGTPIGVFAWQASRIVTQSTQSFR